MRDAKLLEGSVFARVMAEEEEEEEEGVVAVVVVVVVAVAVDVASLAVRRGGVVDGSSLISLLLPSLSAPLDIVR